MLDYIGALTDLGQAVLRGVALSLGLDADYFAAGYRLARPSCSGYSVPRAAARRGRRAPETDRLRPADPFSFPFFFDPDFTAEIRRCRGGRDRRRRPPALGREEPARAAGPTATTCWARSQGISAAPPRGSDRRGPVTVPVTRLLGLQLPDYLERLADVPVDVGHRVEDVPDRAGAVDHVGDPAGEQPDHGRHPVCLADPPPWSASSVNGSRCLLRSGRAGPPSRS